MVGSRGGWVLGVVGVKRCGGQGMVGSSCGGVKGWGLKVVGSRGGGV